MVVEYFIVLFLHYIFIFSRVLKINEHLSICFQIILTDVNYSDTFPLLNFILFFHFYYIFLYFIFLNPIG